MGIAYQKTFFYAFWKAENKVESYHNQIAIYSFFVESYDGLTWRTSAYQQTFFRAFWKVENKVEAYHNHIVNAIFYFP